MSSIFKKFLVCLCSINIPYLYLSAESSTPGGDLTHHFRDQNAFGRPAPLASSDLKIVFRRGKRVFNSKWELPSDSRKELSGLGPLFNASSCGECHFRDGRGRALEKDSNEFSIASSSLVLFLSDENDQSEPLYGGQLQPKGHGGFGSENIPGEGQVFVKYQTQTFKYPDGEEKELLRPQYQVASLQYGELADMIILSPRVAPAVFGLGLLEAIDPVDILLNEDPDDENGDGISGRANWVWNYFLQRKELGRFGWKASHPTLRQQNAAAAVNDMSLMNRIFFFETITKKQNRWDEIPTAATPDNPFELSDQQLNELTIYTHLLAVPQAESSGSSFKKGKEKFIEVGCAHCHTPNWITDPNYEGLPLLAGQKIEPYTNLLLHDLGEGLADFYLDGTPVSSEWRTPPLWGLGLHRLVNGNDRFLHDGRARDIEEAILWHGGEAEAARERFAQLKKQDRNLILDFLRRL